MNELPVRMATRADEEGILSLCDLLHEENGLFEMDRERVRQWVRYALFPDERPSGAHPSIIGVIGEKGSLEAIIFMIVSTFWYAKPDDKHLEELFVFVHPDRRKSTNAKRLVLFAKECADKLGLPLMIGVLSNERTAAKVRLYERLLPQSGAFFFYDPRKKA